MRLLPLFIFWCLWFLNFSNRAAFSPILPLIEDSLSLSHGAAGGLFTSLSIGYALSLLVAGRFVTALGYKRTIVSVCIAITLALIGLQWAESYLGYQILFFLLGTTLGAYLPAILPIITETYEQRHWGKAIALHDSAAGISIFSIPILMAFGLRYLPWKTLLLFLAAFSLLLPIPFWKVSVEPKKAASRKNGSYIDLFKRKSTWIMSLLWVFTSGSNLGVYSIMPLYLVKERGIDYYLATNLVGVSRASGIVAPIVIGFLIDRYGYRAMMKWSILATGLSTIGLALPSDLSMIFIALTFQSGLSLTFFPVGLAALSELTPISERSLAIGATISIGVIFGMGSTPFILGLIADHLNFRVGLLGLGVLTTLSCLGVKHLKETQGTR
jgi:MFS transporter, NNP family, nitrate/nitrite transporter